MDILVKFAGKKLSGSAQEIVRAMADSNMFTEGQLKGEYMQGVSNRMLEIEGALISYESAESFLTDLAHHGKISIFAIN
ncbi:MAG: hypothetical protein ACR2QW_18340 [bacterium]